MNLKYGESQREGWQGINVLMLEQRDVWIRHCSVQGWERKRKRKKRGRPREETSRGEQKWWEGRSGRWSPAEVVRARGTERERERSIPMERRRPFSREGYIEKYIRACNSGEAACICRRAHSQREWIKMEAAGRRRGSSPRGEEGGWKIPASKVRTRAASAWNARDVREKEK